MFSFPIKLPLSLLAIVLATVLQAQDSKNHDLTNSAFGKGLINKYGQDSSWYAKVAFRFQTQYEGTQANFPSALGSDAPFTDRFFVRRARIKGSGWATKSKKWRYKFEYDVNNGSVLDAVIKYGFAPNWEVWFGQTKLPGNMERVISSQKLQLVDRSLLNSMFTLDRDAGIQLHHKHKFGSDFIINEKFAFSQGEGLNQTEPSDGYSYTARIEFLPFGNFKSYVSSDLKRNSDPKLMFGIVYDYNSKAQRSRGQKGDYLSDSRDLQTLFIDAHYKHKGWSMMSEYANRTVTSGSPFLSTIYDEDGITFLSNEVFVTGQSLNAQLGYLFKSNWEIAGRYTTVNPEAETLMGNINQYTLGFSKYIVGHNLKIQGDISFQTNDAEHDFLVFRLQTEFNF